MSHVQVLWRFLEVGWIEVNIDGATRDAPSFATCEGIFRSNHREYMDNFSAFMGIHHALYAKVMDVIFTIAYARLKDFKKLWLECYSPLLYQAFGSTHHSLDSKRR